MTDTLPMTPGRDRIDLLRRRLPKEAGWRPGAGCGRVGPDDPCLDCPCLDCADPITCADWDPRLIGPVPDGTGGRSGDFPETGFAGETFGMGVIWSGGIRRKPGVMPGHDRMPRACAAEYRPGYGKRSVNIAVAFRKPRA